jgi:hypothetical protein
MERTFAIPHILKLSNGVTAIFQLLYLHPFIFEHLYVASERAQHNEIHVGSISASCPQRTSRGVPWRFGGSGGGYHGYNRLVDPTCTSLMLSNTKGIKTIMDVVATVNAANPPYL